VDSAALDSFRIGEFVLQCMRGACGWLRESSDRLMLRISESNGIDLVSGCMLSFAKGCLFSFAEGRFESSACCFCSIIRSFVGMGLPINGVSLEKVKI
jgi:hypothetical protein